jgi:7,8-dihydropterin-6-yl-methyl-4-(beta-D-ribofuranosyl)aminobenzene 5'-phosphate synthase
VQVIKLLIAVAAIAISSTQTSTSQDLQRVTFLYDAFGPASSLERDWGFAALIEYGGRRILFDTGNDAAVFERNATKIGVDLTRLDAVVISHRHGDHTSGLPYLLKVNPGVGIYTPYEGAMFKSDLPDNFLEREPGLPSGLQYYGGQPPQRRHVGTPWPSAKFETVTQTTEILPGFFVLTTRSEKPGTREMQEASLAIRTPRGLVVIVGCSHPGVENILAEAAKIDPRLHLVAGGFHLVGAPQAEVDRVATALHDTLRVARVAPAHCTSERGFATFLKRFADGFEYAGVGAVIELR